MVRFIKYIFVFFLSFYKGIGYSQSCIDHPVAPYNFQDIKLILDNNNCNSCHDGIVHSWNYNKYDQFFISNECGDPIVIKNDASQSVLFDKINGGQSRCGDPMPLKGQKMKESDVIAIEKWINYGAVEYCVPFYEEIKALLNSNDCNSCHSMSNAQSTWQYETYAQMFLHDNETLCQETPIIFKGNAERSLLFQKINKSHACGLDMPPNGNKLDAFDIAQIRDWINIGSPENQTSLPVQISYFDVSNTEETEVKITWITQSEVNTDYFEIQTSRDGLNFKKLAIQNSEGSLNQGKKYEVLSDLNKIGVHYFRIKTVDIDGRIEYSIIKQLLINASKSFLKVIPNPIINMTTIEVEWYSSFDQESVRCFLLDSKGKFILNQVLYKGINYISLPYLQEGLYYLQASEYSGKLFLERIVIVN
jgi:hypothetical protein